MMLRIPLRGTRPRRAVDAASPAARAGPTARARPEARPGMRAANLPPGADQHCVIEWAKRYWLPGLLSPGGFGYEHAVCDVPGVRAD